MIPKLYVYKESYFGTPKFLNGPLYYIVIFYSYPYGPFFNYVDQILPIIDLSTYPRLIFAENFL